MSSHSQAGTAAHAVPARSGATALTLGALGVVFGDIGTSPLYSIQTVFGGSHPMVPDPARVYGILSLVFWALTIIVSLKYITLIMHADNDGEGGIMALISLVQRTPLNTKRAKIGLMTLGIFGASLFYGDGMITPAISVLSAVEGLQVASPSLKSYVLPITLVLLAMLFIVQRFGTGAVGALFGPVMLVWFTTIGILGLWEIRHDPGIARALLPTYAVQFFINDGLTAFLALGAVVLAVTGAEALYADMGHFGRPAIRRAWFLLVLPALFLNYMGQGALVLSDPHAVDNPFYRLVPSWGQLPMVVLAAVATIIASQAVISGAFSVTRQAVQLGYLPRLTIRHTSEREIGQIYVPAINWFLFVAVVALVLGFQSSAHLASAYGIAVTGTLAIDTLLAFVVVRTLWKKPLWMVIVGAIGFLTVDLGFFSANMTKIVSGGWFPLVIAAISFTVLTTWRRGRDIVTGHMRDQEVPIATFLTRVSERPPTRVAGTAVFLTATGDGAPRALLHNVEHNHVLHEHVVLLTAVTKGVPHIGDDDRLAVDDLGEGFLRITAAFGFQDTPDIPAVLDLARSRGAAIDIDEISYFLNRVTLVPTSARGLALWRKRIFVGMSRNATSAALFFGLPSERVVELGTQVEV